MNTININQLKPGVHVWVKGKVAYSHITKFIEGEALRRENQRRANRGQIQAQKPYTTIGITEAQILPASQTGLSLEEQYVQSKFYTKQDVPGVYNYQHENKSPYLPRVSQLREGTTNVYDQITPEGELASGVSVILIMETFASKSFGGKVGLGLNQIMVCEPIRYYNGAGLASAMAERGMTYNALSPEEDRKAVTPKTAAPEAASETPAAAAPASPTGNPYQNTPAPAPVPTPTVPMPTPAAAPAMNPPEPAMQTPPSPWVCPTCGKTVAATMGFCGGCGTKKPETPVPTATGTENPYGGLVYDPNN